jgi:7,8-dihydroneopterin aldolase/epimerase/oxygenase
MSVEETLAEIIVEGLSISCIIGDLPHERNAEQVLSMDLTAQVDIRRTAESDDLSHSLDYVALADLAMQTARNGKYRLVETLAYETIRASFKQFPIIKSLSVRIRKFGCHPSAKTCGILLTLSAHEV